MFDTREAAKKEEEAEKKERFRTAIANVWDMFRIMMTVRHATSLASVPLIAALFCNDCFFISAHLQETSRKFVASHSNVTPSLSLIVGFRKA